MPKKKKDNEPGIPEWVVTYGDLMSLLLCFFILLAAFSELKKPKEYQRVIDAIQEAFGVDGGDGRIENDDLPTFPTPEELAGLIEARDTAKSRSETNEPSTQGINQQTSTLFKGRKWTIGKALPFAPSEHTITSEHQSILKELVAPHIHGQDKLFQVIGHAWDVDDRLGGMDFLDISYKRAREVYEYLVEECEVDPNKLAIVAAGNAQPFDLNAQPAGGMTNRRVEVFMTDVTLSELHPDAAGTGRSP